MRDIQIYSKSKPTIKVIAPKAPRSKISSRETSQKIIRGCNVEKNTPPPSTYTIVYRGVKLPHLLTNDLHYWLLTPL